jgi:hypothetical protein
VTVGLQVTVGVLAGVSVEVKAKVTVGVEVYQVPLGVTVAVPV